jgi:hypothetical protein
MNSPTGIPFESWAGHSTLGGDSGEKDCVSDKCGGKIVSGKLKRTSRFGAPARESENELVTFFRNLTVLAIAATLGAASASAEIAVEVYTFTGQCTDCTGTGTGTLILLADYVLGTPLSADDLFSFNYSSNLIPDLSIHNDPNEALSGILPVGLGPAAISISGTNGSFSTNLDGTWSAFNPPADVGTNGVWSTPSTIATPEPSALTVIGICLAGVMLFGGRRMKAS